MTKRQCVVIWIAILLTVASLRGADQQPVTSPVGVSAKLQGLVLPGSELEAIPITDYKTPIVLRIEDKYVHGDRFRYDLIYYGLDPGRFDLRDYLRRVDGSSKDDLPSIPVEIATSLPPGQVRPNELELESGPRVGGYKMILRLLGVGWFAGLLLLCFWRRGSQKHSSTNGNQPQTLADQLRPLVDQARRGELSEKDQAELERLLLIYWQGKLDVSGLPPSKAMQKLKSDPVAGKLLESLARWLHSPEPDDHDVDVAELLEPYNEFPSAASKVG